MQFPRAWEGERDAPALISASQVPYAPALQAGAFRRQVYQQGPEIARFRIGSHRMVRPPWSAHRFFPLPRYSLKPSEKRWESTCQCSVPLLGCAQKAKIPLTAVSGLFRSFLPGTHTQSRVNPTHGSEWMVQILSIFQ